MGLWFFRVRKSFGKYLSQSSKCTEEEIETQKDKEIGLLTSRPVFLPFKLLYCQEEKSCGSLCFLKENFRGNLIIFYCIKKERRGTEGEGKSKLPNSAR